jgi:hypothetical protein
VGDFTRAGDIEAPVSVPIRIGDVWIERKHLASLYPIGRASIVDVVPMEGEPRRVCVEKADTSREWMDVAELRRRFAFRKAAAE